MQVVACRGSQKWWSLPWRSQYETRFARAHRPNKIINSK